MSSTTTVPTYRRTQSSHIYKTPSNKYRVRISVNGVLHSKTFDKLSDAREWKNKMMKKKNK
jgi:hypothetical protein